MNKCFIASLLFVAILFAEKLPAQIDVQQRKLNSASRPLLTKQNNGYQVMKLRLPFSSVEKEYYVSKSGHYYILNGDIIVGNDLPKTKSLSRDKSLLGWDYHWRNGEIPVEIDQSIYNMGLASVVIAALNELNSKTTLCLKPHEGQDDYVKIVFSANLNGAAGQSPVGRQGGEQELLLTTGAVKSTVMHEMLHAAGFFHEQCREDRDDFIEILEDNIQDGMENNFQTEGGTTHSEYDYCSIMHYSSTAFGNGKTTLRCKKPNNCNACTGKTNLSLSPQDIKGIDEFYGFGRFPCEYQWPDPANPFVKRHTPQNTSSGRAIASLSRIPQSMELWWTTEDGAVETRYWYANDTWKGYQFAPPGSAAAFGSITAASRIPGHMEVWWIGSDGSVQDAYWYEGDKTWHRYQLAPAGSAALKGGITAVSRKPDHLELWWIGPDGSVQSAYWYDKMNSFSRYQLAGPGSASVNGGIAAISPEPGNMDVWWIATDGSVKDAHWYDNGENWKNGELAPAGVASSNGGITAISKRPRHREIIWIGPDGSVYHALENGTHSPGFYGKIAEAKSAAAGSPVTGVTRKDDTEEFWWVSPDGKIMDAYQYNDGKGWRKFPLSDPGFASQTGGISAVSREPGAMEIWTTGKVNEPSGNYHYSTDGYYWYENANWNKYNLDFKPGPSFGKQDDQYTYAPRFSDGYQPEGTTCISAEELNARFIIFMNNRIFLTTTKGKVYSFGLHENELGPAVEQEGPPVAGKEDVDQFVLPYGNRILVVTKNGDVWGHPVAGNNIDQAYPLSGDKLIYTAAPTRNGIEMVGKKPFHFLTISGNIIYGITENGAVHKFEITGNVISRTALSGPKVAANAQDRFVVAMGNFIYVITTDGDVFRHQVAGNKIYNAEKCGGAKVTGNGEADRYVIPIPGSGKNRVMIIRSDCGVWLQDAPGEMKIN